MLSQPHRWRRRIKVVVTDGSSAYKHSVETCLPHTRHVLGRFCDLYATGELPEFHSIVVTIIAWSDETLAWHQTNRMPNGRIESINNLLQVLRRTVHGFTNPTDSAARGILIT